MNIDELNIPVVDVDGILNKIDFLYFYDLQTSIINFLNQENLIMKWLIRCDEDNLMDINTHLKADLSVNTKQTFINEIKKDFNIE